MVNAGAVSVMGLLINIQQQLSCSFAIKQIVMLQHAKNVLFDVKTKVCMLWETIALQCHTS